MSELIFELEVEVRKEVVRVEIRQAALDLRRGRLGSVCSRAVSRVIELRFGWHRRLGCRRAHGAIAERDHG